mmetsp:Transcript_14701/g.41376  ORF Transcript_14701/g.41376 Transcript_14701/m.41376 type:complete len:231 (-) Transcript_14701:214-906(-)
MAYGQELEDALRNEQQLRLCQSAAAPGSHEVLECITRRDALHHKVGTLLILAATVETGDGRRHLQLLEDGRLSLQPLQNLLARHFPAILANLFHRDRSARPLVLRLEHSPVASPPQNSPPLELFVVVKIPAHLSTKLSFVRSCHLGLGNCRALATEPQKCAAGNAAASNLPGMSRGRPHTHVVRKARTRTRERHSRFAYCQVLLAGLSSLEQIQPQVVRQDSDGGGHGTQ